MKTIERMARAIADNVPANSGDLGPDWMCCVGTARAALLAIREPDIGGVFDADPDAPYWYANAASQDFTAMIDAILNETPE